MKKLLALLIIILLAGCVATGKAYLPHTSRVFHAKKNCVGCNDPNPVVFQSVQHAASDSRIVPCSMCVKVQGVSHQGYTAHNYSSSNPIASSSANYSSTSPLSNMTDSQLRAEYWKLQEKISKKERAYQSSKHKIPVPPSSPTPGPYSSLAAGVVKGINIAKSLDNRHLPMVINDLQFRLSEVEAELSRRGIMP